MKFKFPVILLIILPVFAFGCSPGMGEQLRSEISDLEGDAAVIDPETALFIFTIGEVSGTWRWYRDETPVNRLEYGWWADFELEDTSYSCGYRLFKHPFAEPSHGTFKELIEAGQIDLSSRKTGSQEITGNDGLTVVTGLMAADRSAHVKSMIQSGKLIIVLKEQEIVDQFRDLRPDSLSFYSQSGANRVDIRKVAVTYLPE